MLNLSYSQSQYPTVKKIGNDSVLIITLKQGDQMNKKFSSLSDSIKILKTIISNRPSFDTLIAQHADQVNRMHFNFTAERLEKEMYKTELEEFESKLKEKEDRMKRNTMISHLIAFVSITAFSIISGIFKF
jgi:hypothetical protein